MTKIACVNGPLGSLRHTNFTITLRGQPKVNKDDYQNNNDVRIIMKLQLPVISQCMWTDVTDEFMIGFSFPFQVENTRVMYAGDGMSQITDN